jgi:linoleate 10R-lipoxygenase
MLFDSQVLKAAFSSPDALQKQADVMVNVTKDLIEERSFTIVRTNTLSVDIVRDILNVMPIHWIAKLVSLLT